MMDDLKSVKSLIDLLENGDRASRDRILPTVKRCMLFWRGIQHLFWNEAAKDWSMPSRKDLSVNFDERIINYYRGYGESVIAALSAAVPTTQFFPRDADKIGDIYTAKGFNKIEEKIRIENHAEMLLIEMLFTFWNQGFVAVHNCHEYSESYGLDHVPVFGFEEQQSETMVCPQCGSQRQNPEICEVCGIPTPAVVQQQVNQVPTITGYEDVPQGREVLRVYGPLNVKMPMYVKNISDALYLTLETEQHYALMKEIYKNSPALDKIQPGQVGSSDRVYRDDVVLGELNEQLCTVRQTWLRPAAYNMLDEADSELMREGYPDGVCVVQINDEIVEMRAEKLDDYWTVSNNPLSLSLFSDPLAQPTLALQEIRTDLIELFRDTVRYGIPETFADPDVLDFEQYKKVEAAPGLVFPAKARFGQSLESGFFTTRGATLTKEAGMLLQQIDSDFQFVTGAYPSVYGGTQRGGSNTLGEYESSKNQSLQRLSITWKMVKSLWNRTFDKAVRNYRKHMERDETFVKKIGGSYINTVISLAELDGEAQCAYAEANEQFPVSWAQKRSMLFDLINTQDERILSALFHPENVGEIARTLGWSDLYIPGDADRDKQLLEITELLKGQPTEDPMTGMPMASVPVDTDVDDDQVHIETCRAWLISPVGLETRNSNPQGWSNVFAHLLEHSMNVQNMQMQQMQQEQAVAQPKKPGPEPKAQKADDMTVGVA